MVDGKAVGSFLFTCTSYHHNDERARGLVARAVPYFVPKKRGLLLLNPLENNSYKLANCPLKCEHSGFCCDPRAGGKGEINNLVKSVFPRFFTGENISGRNLVLSPERRERKEIKKAGERGKSQTRMSLLKSRRFSACSSRARWLFDRVTVRGRMGSYIVYGTLSSHGPAR